MEESGLIGFSTRHFRIFKLYGFAKKLEVSEKSICDWLVKFVGDHWSSHPSFRSGKSFTCGSLIEVHAGGELISRPGSIGPLTGRWHIYRHTKAEHTKENIDAYMGCLHVHWSHLQRSDGPKIKNIELCVLPVHQKELLAAMSHELLVYKLKA